MDSCNAIELFFEQVETKLSEILGALNDLDVEKLMVCFQHQIKSGYKSGLPSRVFSIFTLQSSGVSQNVTEG